MFNYIKNNYPLASGVETVHLGVDTGGTFTDFVYFDDSGDLKSFKLLSDPKNPARPLKSGFYLLPGIPDYFLHGTTIATNTIIQHSGSKTAFVTTKGFRDLLQIGRQTRPSLYDFQIIKEPQVVPRRLCLEVEERVSASGKIIIPLIESELQCLSEKIRKLKVEAVAVGLLFSYLNPSHEHLIERYLKKHLKIPVTLSSKLLPEFREYERCSTTVINAYLLRPFGDYLNKIRRLTGKMGMTDYFVMQSNGGVAGSRHVQETPVRTLLSGPAAGVSAAAGLGRLLQEPNLITLDMGGTSADVAAVQGNKISWTPEGMVGSHPVKVPMVDIVTIGAGGGSIASIDSGGLLQVGPRSAGADPGPVCYDKGGSELTVTDANLILNIIDPEHFLGGSFRLNKNAALKAAEKFGKTLKMTVFELAEGTRRIVESNMIRAVKKITTEKGIEPGEFSMVAFGGAGPIHASALAEELRIPKVILPPSPGTFSAYGLLVSDIRLDYSKTFLAQFNEAIFKNKVKKILSSHRQAAGAALKYQNIKKDSANFTGSLDLRYKGQSYEVNVPIGINFEDTVKEFHKVHRSTYGYAMENESIELVNVRLDAVARRDGGREERKKSTFGSKRTGRRKKAEKPKTAKTVRLYFGGNSYKSPLYHRSSLGPKTHIEGPALIADSGSTAFIPPGNKAEVDKFGNIIIFIK